MLINNKLIGLFILVCIVLIGGCTSFQPSVYTNESTPYGNKVYATGKAAVQAGSVNTTFNCPSCAVSGQSQQAPRYNRDNRQDESEAEKIYNRATRTLSNEISNTISKAIQDAF
jgi:hypothetical protein